MSMVNQRGIGEKEGQKIGWEAKIQSRFQGILRSQNGGAIEEGSASTSRRHLEFYFQ